MSFNLSLQTWGEFFWDLRDKRLDNWPLMNNPSLVVYLIAAYVLIAVKLGKWYMENKEPFNIRRVIILYNLIMITFNGYLVHQIWTLAWGNDYNWQCEPLDRSLSERSLQIATICWLFMICKFVDWLDTLFFIMTKKFSHISGLHVYHHGIMPFFVWLGTRIYPGGQLTFGILLNGCVHIIMHLYYCLAAMGPKFRKYLWWKKYVTILQLAQFIVGTIHVCQGIFVDCEPDFPKEYAYIFLTQPAFFFYLFYRFYQDNYAKKSNAQLVETDVKNSTKAKKL